MQACRDSGARDVRVARDETERQLLWKGRKSAFGAYGRISPLMTKVRESAVGSPDTATASASADLDRRIALYEMQFRLRTLMIAVTPLVVPLGYVGCRRSSAQGAESEVQRELSGEREGNAGARPR